MSLFVDVHCHLDYKKLLDDVEGVIKRAREAGLKAIITNGINPGTNRLSLELAKRFDIVKASLGIYPKDALKNEVIAMQDPIGLTDFDVDEELSFIERHKQQIIAVGEVGLDYQTGNKRLEQKKLFEKMISFAEKIDKPIIVHSRKAEEDCVNILESSRLKKVVMHCFSGRFSLVKRICDREWYLSIPTNVVRSEHFQKIIREVNLSRLLTETDAPYLSPFKDKTNEPAFIVEAVKKIAEIKQMDQKEVENNIFYNYERLFL
jgi:TatD DNase family protein